MAITKYLPGAIRSNATYVENGYSCDTTATHYPMGQTGVPLSNVYTFTVVPATTSNTCVAASNAWPGASTSYTLNTNATTTGSNPAQIITYPVTINGTAGIALDCERCLSVTFAGTTTTSTTFYVSGYDYRGVAVTGYPSTYSSGSSGTQVLYTPLAVVTSITATANPGVNVSFGNTTGLIGLPYYMPNAYYLINAYFGTTQRTPTDISVADIWRDGAPTSDASNPYGCRGCIHLGDYPDGDTELVMTYFVFGANEEIDNALRNRVQSTINSVGVQYNSTSKNYIWPELTIYDSVGMQYPGDLTAATEYDDLI